MIPQIGEYVHLESDAYYIPALLGALCHNLFGRTLWYSFLLPAASTLRPRSVQALLRTGVAGMTKRSDE